MIPIPKVVFFCSRWRIAHAVTCQHQYVQWKFHSKVCKFLAPQDLLVFGNSAFWSLGHTPKSMRAIKRRSEMFAAICFSGKCIVPKMRIFRHQLRIIQCMLIVMKLLDAKLVQKLVVKTMSALAAISSVSHLLTSCNAWLCSSTGLVMLCLDMFGHLGSHYLMNFTKLVWVPIWKGKFSTAHKRGKFITHLFLSALLCPNSSTHLSNVFCLWYWVSIPRFLLLISFKLSQLSFVSMRDSSKSFGSSN